MGLEAMSKKRRKKRKHTKRNQPQPKINTQKQRNPAMFLLIIGSLVILCSLVTFFYHPSPANTASSAVLLACNRPNQTLDRFISTTEMDLRAMKD